MIGVSPLPTAPYHSFLQDFQKDATDTEGNFGSGVVSDSINEMITLEFEPVERPQEPPSDDGPVEFPSIEAPVLVDEIAKADGEDFTKKLRKRAGCSNNREEHVPKRSAKKRHQQHNKGSQSSNIFQMFNQCKLEL